MAQTFSRSANVIARLLLVGSVVVIVLLASLGAALYRSPVLTQVGIAKAQPIPFSHQRHVGANGIDCRYCHTSVEKSGFAGIPPTETCMTCHSQVLADAPMLAPVHESWKSGESLEWTRVYDVPDFVYFDHSIHIAKGVGCTTCHGDIDDMRLTHKANTLHMGWCLQCHKDPGKFVRPADKVFDPEWRAELDDSFEQAVDGPRLVEENNINVGQLTNCSVCHR